MLTTATKNFPYEENQNILIPNKNGGSKNVAQDKQSLSRLTIRQLRIKASDLRIPLYSRKTKAALIREISLYEEREETERKLLSLPGLNNFAENFRALF